MVGYDGSDESERALERAAELAQALGARLLVATVTRSLRPAEVVPVPLEAPVAAPVPGGVGTPMTVPGPEASRPEPHELAQHVLERARAALARRRVEAEYLAEVGDPAERLLALAREREADLLVVGSREHGILDRLLGRQVDRAIAAGAPCDVLLVH
jgi:nucleotide-binding universal stress UspA family protein